MILIVSEDSDFSAVLAEQVARELKKPCRQAKNFEEAQALMGEAALVITDGASGKCPVPVPLLSVAGKKPLSMRALLAEIERKLQPADEIRLGGYVFSPRARRLGYGGKSTDLTDKETQLLQSMIEAGKQGIGKDELLKQVWGMAPDLNTHTLETHIYRLRGKFRELSGDDTVLEATEGGYRTRA